MPHNSKARLMSCYAVGVAWLSVIKIEFKTNVFLVQNTESDLEVLIK